VGGMKKENEKEKGPPGGHFCVTGKVFLSLESINVICVFGRVFLRS